jgi:hypothetical protein
LIQCFYVGCHITGRAKHDPAHIAALIGDIDLRDLRCVTFRATLAGPKSGNVDPRTGTGIAAAATDSTRVLRLPGFSNRKYRPPHIVTARSEAKQTYHLEDFKLRTDIDEDRREHLSTYDTRRREPHQELSQSERDWAFAKRALARGDPPEEVIRRIADYHATKNTQTTPVARLRKHK